MIGPFLMQVLAKLRAELTYSVFESVDATERGDINPQRESLLASGKHALLVRTDFHSKMGST